MKYILIFFIVISLTSCISNNSSSINAVMGIPEMLIDNELNQQTLMEMAKQKRKPTVPVDPDITEDYYEYN